MPPESRTLTLALDDHTVALAAEALRGEADRRRRAGIALSAELTEKKRNEGADIRTASGQVVAVLAEAASLAAAADQLSDAWEAGKPAKRVPSKRAAKPVTVDQEPATPGPDAPDVDDELDELNELDLIDPESLPDGSTVTAHDDDPDVLAARAQLLGDGPPVAVAPAIPTT